MKYEEAEEKFGLLMAELMRLFEECPELMEAHPHEALMMKPAGEIMQEREMFWRSIFADIPEVFTSQDPRTPPSDDPF